MSRYRRACLPGGCYFFFNPVKHALVTDLAEWPWSTYHRYVRQGYYETGGPAAGIRDLEAMETGGVVERARVCAWVKDPPCEWFGYAVIPGFQCSIRFAGETPPVCAGGTPATRASRIVAL